MNTNHRGIVFHNKSGGGGMTDAAIKKFHVCGTDSKDFKDRPVCRFKSCPPVSSEVAQG